MRYRLAMNSSRSLRWFIILARVSKCLSVLLAWPISIPFRITSRHNASKVELRYHTGSLCMPRRLGRLLLRRRRLFGRARQPGRKGRRDRGRGQDRSAQQHVAPVRQRPAFGGARLVVHPIFACLAHESLLCVPSRFQRGLLRAATFGPQYHLLRGGRFPRSIVARPPPERLDGCICRAGDAAFQARPDGNRLSREARGERPCGSSAGQVIVEEGDPAEQAFILMSGWVLSCTRFPDGSNQVRRLHFPGDLLAMPSVPMRHHAEDLEAISDALIAPFPKAWLAGLFGMPRLAAIMYMFAQAERITAGDRLASVGHNCAKKRLAFLLVDILHRLRSADASVTNSYYMHLTREQMAQRDRRHAGPREPHMVRVACRGNGPLRGADGDDRRRGPARGTRLLPRSRRGFRLSLAARRRNCAGSGGRLQLLSAQVLDLHAQRRELRVDLLAVADDDDREVVGREVLPRGGVDLGGVDRAVDRGRLAW